MDQARCPECRDQVRLPSSASAAATVRCPLCGSEFSLRSLLSELPPELEVLHDPQAISSPARDEFKQSSESGPLKVALDPPTFPFLEGPAPRKPRQRQRGESMGQRPSRRDSPFWAFFKIVAGGLGGLVIGQLILWYLPLELGDGQRDPAGLGRALAPIAPWVVPPQLRPPAANDEPFQSPTVPAATQGDRRPAGAEAKISVPANGGLAPTGASGVPAAPGAATEPATDGPMPAPAPTDPAPIVKPGATAIELLQAVEQAEAATDAWIFREKGLPKAQAQKLFENVYLSQAVMGALAARADPQDQASRQHVELAARKTSEFLESSAASTWDTYARYAVWVLAGHVQLPSRGLIFAGTASSVEEAGPWRVLDVTFSSKSEGRSWTVHVLSTDALAATVQTGDRVWVAGEWLQPSRGDLPESAPAVRQPTLLLGILVREPPSP